LATGAAATIAAAAHDVNNFLSAKPLYVPDRFILGAGGAGSTLAGAGAHDPSAYGFAAHASIDHGLADAAGSVFKA
jgi:hypothetical protein